MMVQRPKALRVRDPVQGEHITDPASMKCSVRRRCGTSVNGGESVSSAGLNEVQRLKALRQLLGDVGDSRCVPQ
ncbi:hypothetical protein [Nocardia fluminea]|uniref:hypothetical protein n=1 Tax=Nocardia fluminea TaxID=134984 RepID=UPI0033F46B01